MRIVIIAVLLVSAAGIWGCANDSGPLSGFSPDKVEKVGFSDDNDTLYYEFPKADAESFVNVITKLLTCFYKPFYKQKTFRQRNITLY